MYFAIIPAMFAGTFPVLNVLIIIALIPLALRGVKYRPMSAEALYTMHGSSIPPAAIIFSLSAFLIPD